MKNRKSQFGFTLIEMLVVVFLIAVFAVIAVPSFRALTADNQIIGALNDFANTLGAARAEAVARGRTVIVCPSSNALTGNPPTCNSQTGPQQWNTGWISFVDVEGDDKYDAGTDTVLRVHGPIANGVSLTSPQGGGPVSGFIGFNRMGFASPTFTGKIRLIVKACATGTNHVHGGTLTLVLAGTLSTQSGGC